jgi:hypothetical protein
MATETKLDGRMDAISQIREVLGDWGGMLTFHRSAT